MSSYCSLGVYLNGTRLWLRTDRAEPCTLTISSMTVQICLRVTVDVIYCWIIRSFVRWNELKLIDYASQVNELYSSCICNETRAGHCRPLVDSLEVETNLRVTRNNVYNWINRGFVEKDEIEHEHCPLHHNVFHWTFLWHECLLVKQSMLLVILHHLTVKCCAAQESWSVYTRYVYKLQNTPITTQFQAEVRLSDISLLCLWVAEPILDPIGPWWNL